MQITEEFTNNTFVNQSIIRWLEEEPTETDAAMLLYTDYTNMGSDIDEDLKISYHDMRDEEIEVFQQLINVFNGR